jgi:signal transduction histidine kinase
VSNAIKYGAADRPIDVAIAAGRSGVTLSVHNEGPPLAPEEQAQLFVPFRRGRRGRQPGWGLGLTLVKACAEAHGGRVEVRSSVEEGTTFSLHLPADARLHAMPTDVDAAN